MDLGQIMHRLSSEIKPAHETTHPQELYKNHKHGTKRLPTKRLEHLAKTPWKKGCRVECNVQVGAKILDLSKVIRLLEDPLTTNLKKRHLFAFKKLLKRNQTGFLLRELTDISRILNICAEKAKDHCEYASVLCEALKICRLPFLKERVTDEINYAQDVTEFLSNIGCLMRVSDAAVRQHVVETVKSFFSSEAQIKQHDGLQPTSPGYRLQLLERSDLPKTLLLSMAALETQPAIKLQLLQTLQILLGSSDLNCASIVHERGAETICLHMNEPDPSGQVLLCSSEILWNLLEGGSREEVIAQLSSMECVLSLKEAFSHLLENASHHSDLQLRNDLLAITTLIAETPNSVFIESLFANQLVGFATFPESRSPGFSNCNFTYSNEDLKMKKLLLNLLVLLCRDVAALQLYREEQVMLYLLQLLKPFVSAERRPGSHHWSVSQQEELQLQTLVTLSSIAPSMLDDYMSCQGNTCLLLLLDWCVGAEPYFSQGHSFYGTGGRGSKKAQMRHCIRALRSVTCLGHESVNQDLCDQGAMNQFLRILIQIEANSEEEDVIVVEMMSDIQLILSALCETDVHRKDLFGSEGVDMAVHFLKKGSEKFYSGLGHNKLILSTVGCVRSCIVGCYITEFHFLAKEGTFLLLNLLRTGPRCVHGVVLSTLLDLCDNPNTRAQILSWRDVDGQTAPRLLLQLWREEEEELGVIRDHHGGIKDPKKPIITRYQQDESSATLPAPTPSAAVLEISENIRAKIYFIFCTLGFLELPGLSAEDYVSLSVVKRYLDFKVGEVWDEVRRELVLEDVRPISPDQEALRSICETTEDTARKVMVEQSSILEQQQKEEIREEMLIYTEMLSHRKQLELKIRSWNSYASRTSNYKILKEEKAQREKYIDSTRPKPRHEAGRPAERFIGQILAVERTGSQGPAGVNVKLARVAIKPEPAQRNLEFFSGV